MEKNGEFHPLSREFSSVDYRQAMGTFCTGVTVVTVPTDSGVHGMTANSFTSVSLEPPLILISVMNETKTQRYIRESKRFGVNILLSNQVDLSTHFAGKPNPDVESTIAYDWFEQIPVLSRSLTNLACRLWAEYDGGDHTLFVGKVLALRTFEPQPPLVFYGGKYTDVTTK